MGLKGQRDQFAEAHLSAPALFTHHLRSERQVSQELSCSHNTAALHFGGGGHRGELVVVCAHRPAAFPLLFIIRPSDETCRQNLIRDRKGFDSRGLSALILTVLRHFLADEGLKYMKALRSLSMNAYFEKFPVKTVTIVDFKEWT